MSTRGMLLKLLKQGPPHLHFRQQERHATETPEARDARFQLMSTRQQERHGSVTGCLDSVEWE